MVQRIIDRLSNEVAVAEQSRHQALIKAFDRFGVSRPRRPTGTPVKDIGVPTFQIDHEAAQAISDLVQVADMSLGETIRTCRGQSEEDRRPNAALPLEHYNWLLHDYDQLPLLVQVAQEGVRHDFRRPTHSCSSAPNHASAKVMANALRRSIRDGQDNNTYLVVNSATAARWPELRYSPFGCVPKAGTNPEIEARVIHDLSFPIGDSINSGSDQNQIPALSYTPVAVIARRIVELRSRWPQQAIKLMKGDVKSAFRQIPVHEETSAQFVGKIPEADAVVIDLALPFGWTGSPAHYGVFGQAISHLVSRESPHRLDPSNSDDETFFSYVWVDDHILVETDTGNRLSACESALRLAMVAVLGPRAINEKKFTPWSSSLVALGLEWNSSDMHVSMPTAKIDKARDRVCEMLSKTTTTRSQLAQLLGSLRHVCTCIRPARPFFQRLAALYRSSYRAARVPLTTEARRDLLWFDFILRHGRLRSVPLEHFYQLPEPAVHIYMDASNHGLCALHPAKKEFLRVQFDEHERAMIQNGAFSINVREQFSAALAILCWGPDWQSTSKLIHIRFWIDNAAAVSWCNNLSSTNTSSQELNRVIGAAEGVWGLRVSAEHLAGSSNFLADLGSRAWSGRQLARWRQLTSGWTQVRVNQRFRMAYNSNWSSFNCAPSPTRRSDNTHPHGVSGSPSAVNPGAPHGSHATTQPPSLFSLFCSLCTSGQHPGSTTGQPPLPPYSRSLATSSGIIVCTRASTPNSAPATPPLSSACVGSAALHSPEPRSPSQCCSGLPTVSTFRTHSSVSFLGLRCWGSSFFSEAPSICQSRANVTGMRSKCATCKSSTTTDFQPDKVATPTTCKSPCAVAKPTSPAREHPGDSVGLVIGEYAQSSEQSYCSSSRRRMASDQPTPSARLTDRRC